MDYNYLGPGLGALFQGQQAEQDITSQDIKNRQAQQTMDFEAQKQPLSLQELSLRNAGTDIANQTNSQNLGDLVASQDVRRQYQNRDFQQKVTDMDKKNAQNFLDAFRSTVPMLRGIQSPLEKQVYIAQMAQDNGLTTDHPVVRSILGVAQHEPSKDMPDPLGTFADQLAEAQPKGRETELSERAKQQRQIELEKQRGEEARRTRQMEIDAGRYKKGTAFSNVEEALQSGKLNYERAAVLLENAATTADLEGETEKAAAYRSRANDYHKKNIENRSAGIDAGGAFRPDLNKLNIPTNPGAQASPFQTTPQPGQPSPAQNDWVRRAQQANPNMPIEKIIEQGKRLGKL